MAILIGMVCVSAVHDGCDNPAKNPASGYFRAKTEGSAVPEDIFSAAAGALGSEVEVFAWGDLALSGRQQILAINRLNKPDAEHGNQRHLHPACNVGK